MQKVFILGNPRSGTSLLRIMLNAHPRIAAPPECGFLQWWYAKYGKWNVRNLESRDDITRYADDVLTSKKIETWGLDRAGLIDFIEALKPSDYAGLALSVYRYWAEINHKHPSVIVDKNNYYIRHLRDLNQIWPDARYIYIIRDGRDVACSYLDIGTMDLDSPYRPELPGRLKDIANEWVKNNTSIRNFLNDMNANRFKTIRYEDLILTTQNVLQEITDFFEIPFSGRMLEYYKYNDEPESTLEWKRKTLEPPDATVIGKYKKQLSGDDITLFESVAAGLLQQYNYL